MWTNRTTWPKGRSDDRFGLDDALNELEQRDSALESSQLGVASAWEQEHTTIAEIFLVIVEYASRVLLGLTSGSLKQFALFLKVMKFYELVCQLKQN